MLVADANAWELVSYDDPNEAPIAFIRTAPAVT